MRIITDVDSLGDFRRDQAKRFNGPVSRDRRPLATDAPANSKLWRIAIDAAQTSDDVFPRRVPYEKLFYRLGTSGYNCRTDMSAWIDPSAVMTDVLRTLADKLGRPNAGFIAPSVIAPGGIDESSLLAARDCGKHPVPAHCIEPMKALLINYPGMQPMSTTRNIDGRSLTQRPQFQLPDNVSGVDSRSAVSMAKVAASNALVLVGGGEEAFTDFAHALMMETPVVVVNVGPVGQIGNCINAAGYLGQQIDALRHGRELPLAPIGPITHEFLAENLTGPIADTVATFRVGKKWVEMGALMQGGGYWTHSEPDAREVGVEAAHFLHGQRPLQQFARYH